MSKYKSLPKSYIRQGGCRNCVHCFFPWNPEAFEGYCVFGVTVPKGSARYKFWTKLQPEKAVDAAGRCDHYEKGEGYFYDWSEDHFKESRRKGASDE